MGFDRVDFVSSPGEFAVRGGIIDVFSFAYQHPYRIEFFDETIERLSCFDVVSQRSISNFEEVELLPNISDQHNTDKRKIFTSFFSENTCIIYSDFDKIISLLLTWITFICLLASLANNCRSAILKSKLIISI